MSCFLRFPSLRSKIPKVRTQSARSGLRPCLHSRVCASAPKLSPERCRSWSSCQTACARCLVVPPSVPNRFLRNGRDAERRKTSLPEVFVPSDGCMTEACCPTVPCPPCPKLRCDCASLRSPDRPLTSLNTQGSRASGWKRLVQPAPCGVACFAPFRSVAHLPLSLAKSFPSWRRPWGFPLQSLFSL